MTQIAADSTQMSADFSLTETIIGAAYAVHNELGSGFLEAVYRRALMVELRLSGLAVEAEVPLTVYYKNVCVGEYRADLLVASEIIVEIKACMGIISIHEQQLLHYLYATRRSLGLLVNFGNSVTVKRKLISKNLRQSALNLR